MHGAFWGPAGYGMGAKFCKTFFLTSRPHNGKRQSRSPNYLWLADWLADGTHLLGFATS
jgi:hypothetical protein